MKRLSIILLASLITVNYASAAFYLTASKVTVQDLTVDKYNFFVTVDAATSTGEYEVCFDVWPATRSVIGSFSAQEQTIGYVSSAVHKTKANGKAVDMWYSCYDDSEITLTIAQKNDSVCTLSGSIQAWRSGSSYTYIISDFDFTYTEKEPVTPEPEKDPYRFEPTEATSFAFTADVIHFRDRNEYIEVTLNEMANETYNWIELRLLSDTLAMPAGIYPIDSSWTAGTLTASAGFLGGTKGDDPCYVAIRGNKDEWGQYTPYYLKSGALQVCYNELGDTITISGKVISRNGSEINVFAKSYNMLYVPEETPPQPEKVQLAIDTVFVTYRSDLSDSLANIYLYTFQFSHHDDYPTVIADITTSKPMELEEGAYTLQNSKLSGVQLAQNQYDFEANIYTGAAYTFVTAELSLTQAGDSAWTYAMYLRDTIGSEYSFEFSQAPHIYHYPQPTVDPKEVPFADESKEKATITVNLDTLVWNDATVAKDGILDIYVTQINADVNGFRAYLHLGFYTDTSYPQEGIYPVNGSEENGTFSASIGRFGNALIPCYLALMDNNGWAHAIWYITEGSITLSYNALGQPVLSGDCTSHYGSTIHFTYAPSAQGMDYLQRSNAQSAKCIINGQFLIEKNGKLFNALGQTVQ